MEYAVMIHLTKIFCLFCFVYFAQYYSVCLFNSVLLCKVMSYYQGAYNHQIHPSPVHQTW